VSDDLDMDYEERRGGMLIGRQAALADWRFRKEQREFEKQIKTLRAAKWNQEHPERRKEIANTYARKPEVVQRQARTSTARRHRARAKARVAGARVYRCKECGAEWCSAPWTRGLAGRGEFCGDACRQRYRYQEKTPGARRIRRHR
jgi:hypothetical protein